MSQLSFAAFAKTIIAVQPQGERLLIGIDGPGGSGKSTFARALGGVMGATVISMDEFYLPRHRRPTDGDHGFQYDLERVRDEVLWPAQDGDPIRYQRYRWDDESLIEWVDVVDDDSPIIIEGVYALAVPLMRFYDYTMLVDCDDAVRLERGIARDGEELREKWLEEWMPLERAYFADSRLAEVVDFSMNTTGGSR